MDIIKDNPFWGEERVYSRAEAWIYLQTNDISIRDTAKLFGWSTTKLYDFLKLTGIKQIKNTPKKTVKKTLQKPVTNSNTITSIEVAKNKKTLEKTPKKTLEERKKDFGSKLIPYVEKYGKEMIRDFFNYWSEHNEGGKLMAFEMKKTFSIPHRLATWKRKEEKYGNFKTKRDIRLEESAKRKQELINYAINGDNENKDVVF